MSAGNLGVCATAIPANATSVNKRDKVDLPRFSNGGYLRKCEYEHIAGVAGIQLLRQTVQAGTRQRVADAGLAYDRRTGNGVVIHLLDCLKVDGRLGYTAMADHAAGAAQLESQLVTALS